MLVLNPPHSAKVDGMKNADEMSVVIDRELENVAPVV
jgi:hypothetical protein